MDEDHRLTRIESKIDTIGENIGESKIDIALIKKDLAEHMRRTHILEKKVYPVWLSYQVALYIIGLVTLASAVYTILGYYVK